MKEKIIGVKQLRTNLGAIARAIQRGDRFLVMRHHTPLFRIEAPAPLYEESRRATGKLLLEAFKPAQFKTGDPDLSKKIDEIAYGV